MPTHRNQTLPQIGLFGGSFDPPHLGHVAIAEAGIALGLDEVWVLPAQPVHRQLSGCADGATRLRWLERIFLHHPRIKVLDWELQVRPVPAIDTLRRFALEAPEATAWFMLGADAWQGIESWVEYPAHLQHCNMLVFHRAGNTPRQIEPWRPVDVIDIRQRNINSAGHCCMIDIPLPDISATELRRDAAAGKPLAGRVAEVIRDDIEAAYRKRREHAQRGSSI